MVINIKYANISKNFFKDRYDSTSNKYIVPDIASFHHTAGLNYMSAVNHFLYNDTTSANFIIDLDGTCYEIVDIRNGAWCNGTSSDPNNIRYHGLATSKIVKSRKENANLYTISVEFVGKGYPDSGKLTQAQVETAAELLKYLKAEIKTIYGKDFIIDREHVIGHYEISPLTKGKCGVDIQYDEIIEKANKSETLYYVRKNWESKNSQIGVYKNLDLAKNLSTYNYGYSVYNSDGNKEFTPNQYYEKYTTIRDNIPIKFETKFTAKTVTRFKKNMDIYIYYGEKVKASNGTVWVKFTSKECNAFPNKYAWIPLKYIEKYKES